MITHTHTYIYMILLVPDPIPPHTWGKRGKLPPSTETLTSPGVAWPIFGCKSFPTRMMFFPTWRPRSVSFVRASLRQGILEVGSSCRVDVDL